MVTKTISRKRAAPNKKGASGKRGPRVVTVVVDPRKGARLSIVVKPVTARVKKDGKVVLDPPGIRGSSDVEPDKGSAAAIVIRIKG